MAETEKSLLLRDIAQFITDRESRGLSLRTVQYYRDELRWLSEYLATQNVSTVEAITPHHLRKFFLAMQKRRNKGGVHCAYRVAKTFLRWWGDEFEPDNWRNPIVKVRVAKPSNELLPPAPLEDIQAMLKVCDKKTFTGARNVAIVLALLDTGCRASEFVALDIQDANLRDGSVIVKHGKGNKQRVVFLGKKTRLATRRYLRRRKDVQAESPLWVTQAGNRLTYAGLRSIVRRLAEQAGVDCPSLHSFRRAFALQSLRNGADVYSLQGLMGHGDLTVLRRYLKQTREDLQATHRRCSPVDRGGLR